MTWVALVVVAGIVVAAIVRLLWRLARGDELTAGGSDGRQVFRRRDR